MMRKTAVLALYFLVFWVFLPAMVIGISGRLEDSLNLQPLKSTLAGTAILLVSVPFLGVAVWQYFKGSGNLPVSAYPPSQIMRKGLYNYFRHPIYLFYTLTLAGVALVLGSRAMLFVVMPFFILLTWIYIRWEENTLLHRFGEAYALYKSQTGLVLPAFYHWVRIPLRIVFRYLFGIQFKTAALANIPPPFFIVAKHKNYLDPFYIALAVPYPVSYLATFEVFRSPLLGWFMRRFFSIPRKRFRTDFASIRYLTRTISNGGIIGLFPEGERSWTGETRDFKPEVMKLLCKMNPMPVLPVRIEGNYHAWPRWANGFRRYRVTVECMDPVYPGSGCTPPIMEKMIKDSIGRNEIRGVPVSLVRDPAVGLEKVFYRCSVCRTFNSFKSAGNLIECGHCGLKAMVSPNLDVRFAPPGPEIPMSIAGYYQTIRVTPEEPFLKNLIIKGTRTDDDTETTAGSLKESGKCRLYLETANKFNLVMNGDLKLGEIGMVFTGNNREIVLKYREISSITTESNCKLQIYNPVTRQLFQVEFITGSVLQWQDILASAILLKAGRTINTR